LEVFSQKQFHFIDNISDDLFLVIHSFSPMPDTNLNDKTCKTVSE